MTSAIFNLAGKKALVTGGAHGLGRMIAEGLLEAGAEVVLTSRRAEVCEQAAAALSRIGPCTPLAADLSAAGVDALVARYRDVADGCHILINNAGRTWGAPLDTFPDSAWPGVMAVNVQAPFKLVQALLPELTRSGTADDPARVINIGSAAGATVQPIQAYSYGASKAALHHLGRLLAADLAARHVTVNTIVPGFFPTSMTAHLRNEAGGVDPGLLEKIPLRRLGRAEDIVGAVVFLASRAGAYVTGAEIPVDGGLIGCR